MAYNVLFVGFWRHLWGKKSARERVGYRCNTATIGCRHSTAAIPRNRNDEVVIRMRVGQRNYFDSSRMAALLTLVTKRSCLQCGATHRGLETFAVQSCSRTHPRLAAKISNFRSCLALPFQQAEMLAESLRGI
jgi:hypothetical protein